MFRPVARWMHTNICQHSAFCELSCEVTLLAGLLAYCMLYTQTRNNQSSGGFRFWCVRGGGRQELQGGAKFMILVN